MADAPIAPEDVAEAERLVQRHFGFAGLRPGQAETLVRVRRGEDVLALLPTGGGKSICYQLPAVLSKGVTLVVSPLLALMKDQLDSLPAPMRAAAASLTSELPARDQRLLLAEIARGRYRLLYVAPERLRDARLMHALHEAGVARLVVDEAHCVSTWGHDFRPEYLSLADARAKLGSPPVLALTATAPPRVQRDILDRLGPMTVVRAPLDRPNLRLEAVHAKDADEKIAHLLRLCLETPGPGVVYASSRAKCEQLATVLQRAGLRAEAYHAGHFDRAQRQDAFMRGAFDIMVATVAFGMGVDKQDLRFVFHHDPSGSLENYWQEAGRAGRDGQRARCVVLAARQDATTLRTRAKADLPSPDLIGGVWKLVVETLHEDKTVLVDPGALAKMGDEPKPAVALSILEEAGALERLAPSDAQAGLLVYRVLGDTTRVETVLERYAKRATERADEMLAYVHAKGCRVQHVRRFFGEPQGSPCQNCDTCLHLVHEPLRATAEDDQHDARAVLDALEGMRGLGEVNLVYHLRGDARAPDWLASRAGFGALGHRSESKVKEFVRDLVARGRIVRETLPHGGTALRLAREGDAPPPPVPRPSAPSPSPPPAEDAPVFDALRQWRRAVADAEGVPPYVVAHDSTLRAIAAARPSTLDALRAVKGMGPKKVEKHGADILRVLGGGPTEPQP